MQCPVKHYSQQYTEEQWGKLENKWNVARALHPNIKIHTYCRHSILETIQEVSGI